MLESKWLVVWFKGQLRSGEQIEDKEYFLHDPDNVSFLNITKWIKKNYRTIIPDSISYQCGEALIGMSGEDDASDE